MSRPIPYNALPIPKLALDAEEIVPKFKDIRRLKLPGILISEAGHDAPTAMNNLKPILAACGVTIHCSLEPVQTEAGNGDKPLHLDAIPSNENTVGMVVQCTDVGEAAIVLARLADPFCEELTRRNEELKRRDPDIPPEKWDYDLPEDTEALLDEGLVNPEVLQPDVYMGSVAVGGAIMFAFGGPHPVAHRFRTLTAKRRAQGYIVPFTRL